MKQIIFLVIMCCAVSVFAEKGLAFDLGTEPEENGNTSYGMVQWGWTDNIASRIDLKYTNSHKTEDEVAGYGNATDVSKSNTFELSLLPVVKYFGSTNNFSLSAGFSYQFSKEKEKAGMFDVNGIMLDEGDEGKYFTYSHNKRAHFIAPRLGFTADLPFYEHFKFAFSSFVHPIYFVKLNQDICYHSDQTQFDYSGNDSLFKLSYPYIFTKASFDAFDYARLLAQFSYQRLDFRQMDWTEDYNSLEGKDDVQNITTFRIGLELLSGKNKKARVRGGIYRQYEWNKSSYRDNTEKESKWIISFGTEM